ncbi:hypothetical protein [Flavobacterium sp. LC2016-13]|uniref:phosphorylase family protein n=1 Tax=Flavobacterium sp. LC2016-13 TaxID=2675875 RepID=UPI0012BA0557|nr:hypothetical protein [Flavobacterium sp. LC2016-13]
MEISEKSYDEVKHLIPDINLLLITANDIETFHVRQALLPLEDNADVLKVPHGQHTYFIGIFGEYLAVHVQLGKMGSISYNGAILTSYDAIEAWHPKAVVMVGVAMGTDESKQKIGDVLISEAIISYESQRLGSEEIVQRGPIVDPGVVLFNRFKNSTGWSSPIENGLFAKKRIGHILSGEKLIDNLAERNIILSRYPNAIGAEMEGAGIYAACKTKNVNEWILVKGICDYGDGNKGVDKEKRQNLASQCATSLTLKVFMSRVGFVTIGLEPVIRKTITKEDDVTLLAEKFEGEIVAIIELNNRKEDMHSAVQTTVAAFLDLSSYQKANVIDDIDLPLSNFIELSGHEMDKEIFRLVKERNLLPNLWDAINKIKPFTNNKNPFV